MSPAARGNLGLLQIILIALIYVYRHTLGLFIGGRCRFYPSCSQYALDAVRIHGGLRGSWMTSARLLRCHPWHPGGPDPVPEVEPKEREP